ncbi:MAG TPA: C1 family peptidase [Salinivirga sp.]|uniref:C1 family peptidase n=1 Tax=Salinivirga sp. TaxID=1970192 RepID=UPI002B4895B0|nr:C1 family peptidase [Salinivirga sp.]HKK59623.1 C1 family peptidase [Salinivirga sp.]
MKAHLSAILIMVFIVGFLSYSNAQETENTTAYGFNIVKELPHTMAKDQGRAGTCWSFATTSFLESEIMRMGKDSVDLSEMFFVYHAYLDKAQRYIMRHGQTNFSQGGQAHDVMNVIREEGMVPEKAYTGIAYEGTEHNHSEVVAMMHGMLDKLAQQRNKMPLWIDAFRAVMDVYFGILPENFEWNGKEVTSKEFQKSLAVNPDDYVELTSYEFYPYYTSVNLDIPDNWSFDHYYNVKLEELIETIDYAIAEGYTVCWDGDVSEHGFNHGKGFAVLPTEDAFKEESYLNDIAPEKEVTTDLREATFMSQESTDDHLMHLIGTSEDREGNPHYIIKNSWNHNSNDFQGKLHMSLPFVKAKTIAIMVHKDAVPKKLRKKLDF